MLSSDSRILLTGASGQVGGDLLPLLQSFATVITPDLPDFDLVNAHATRSFVKDVRPDWIINPAAYTAVDKAESEAERAYAINKDAPRVLGEAAAELGIPVIHFSTDYVYNGGGTRPWVETDEPGPLGVYGASKLAGDVALANSGAAHLIFRTSWVYSSRGRNFLLTILRLAQEKEDLRIVDDQHGAPTWSRDLARMVVHVMRRIAEHSRIDRQANSGGRKGGSGRLSCRQQRRNHVVRLRPGVCSPGCGSATRNKDGPAGPDYFRRISDRGAPPGQFATQLQPPQRSVRFHHAIVAGIHGRRGFRAAQERRRGCFRRITGAATLDRNYTELVWPDGRLRILCGDFLAGFSSFGKSDGNGLFSVLHLLAAPSGLELTFLHRSHLGFHALSSRGRVFPARRFFRGRLFRARALSRAGLLRGGAASRRTALCASRFLPGGSLCCHIEPPRKSDVPRNRVSCMAIDDP